MAGIVLEKGKTIYSYGQPMTALHLITNGRVDVSYPGGSYPLGKGDVIGICEICSEIHLLSYTTLEDTTILTYPDQSGFPERYSAEASGCCQAFFIVLFSTDQYSVKPQLDL